MSSAVSAPTAVLFSVWYATNGTNPNDNPTFKVERASNSAELEALLKQPAPIGSWPHAIRTLDNVAVWLKSRADDDSRGWDTRAVSALFSDTH